MFVPVLIENFIVPVAVLMSWVAATLADTVILIGVAGASYGLGRIDASRNKN